MRIRVLLFFVGIVLAGCAGTQPKAPNNLANNPPSEGDVDQTLTPQMRERIARLSNQGLHRIEQARAALRRRNTSQASIRAQGASWIFDLLQADYPQLPFDGIENDLDDAMRLMVMDDYQGADRVLKKARQRATAFTVGTMEQNQRPLRSSE